MINGEMGDIKSKVYSVILTELISEYSKIGIILNNKRLFNSLRVDKERRFVWEKAKGIYDLVYNDIQELINRVDSTLDNSEKLTQNINKLVQSKASILNKLHNLKVIVEPFRRYSHFK